MPDSFHRHYQVVFEFAVNADPLPASDDDLAEIFRRLQARLLASPPALHRFLQEKVLREVADFASGDGDYLIRAVLEGEATDSWDLMAPLVAEDTELREFVEAMTEPDQDSYAMFEEIDDSFVVDWLAAEVYPVGGGAANSPPRGAAPTEGSTSTARASGSGVGPALVPPVVPPIPFRPVAPLAGATKAPEQLYHAAAQRKRKPKRK